MKCMNCGAELTEAAYCPKCGCDVSVQKQAIVLSGLYYNQGLEKAQVRDLSGAIDQLKRSLKFNKLNVPARNLLGLVYFETGEVVAALSEWVISKNIKPEDNIAAEYIRNLQQDANRLDIINQTIKKYNLALKNCLEGNEDVALIQLKKILAQNQKLIKGYHLLALLYIHNGEYEKARKLLKKAIKIDKTNTTTLRFLREVDEQTGTATALENHFPVIGGRHGAEETAAVQAEEAASSVITPTIIRGSNARASLLNILIGIVLGAAAVWVLFIPAYTASVNRSANEKITRYASDISVYTAEIDNLSGEIEDAESTASSARKQAEEASSMKSSYDALLAAVNLYNSGGRTEVGEQLALIDADTLSTDAQAVYDYLKQNIAGELIASYKESGISECNNGDFEAAIKDLEAAVALGGDNDAVLLMALGNSYAEISDTENADRIYLMIISGFPYTSQATTAYQSLSDSSLEAGAAAKAAAEAAYSTAGISDEESDDGSDGDDSEYDSDEYDSDEYDSDEYDSDEYDSEDYDSDRYNSDYDEE